MWLSASSENNKHKKERASKLNEARFFYHFLFPAATQKPLFLDHFVQRNGAFSRQFKCNGLNMKCIKTLIIAVVAVLSMLGFGACTRNTTEWEAVSAMVLTACRNASGGVYLLGDDTTKTYKPIAPLVLHDSLIGRRCYVEYSHLEPATDYTYTIKLTYVHFVGKSSVAIVNSDNEAAAFGNAPLEPVWAWISGHYLNVVFDYYGTSLVEHAFSLVRKANAVDSVGAVRTVELRHDLNGDQPKALLSEVVSFDLAPLGLDTVDMAILRVKYSSFNGSDTYYDVNITDTPNNRLPAKHRGQFGQ